MSESPVNYILLFLFRGDMIYCRFIVPVLFFCFALVACSSPSGITPTAPVSVMTSSTSASTLTPEAPEVTVTPAPKSKFSDEADLLPYLITIQDLPSGFEMDSTQTEFVTNQELAAEAKNPTTRKNELEASGRKIGAQVVYEKSGIKLVGMALVQSWLTLYDTPKDAQAKLEGMEKEFQDEGYKTSPVSIDSLLEQSYAFSYVVTKYDIPWRYTEILLRQGNLIGGVATVATDKTSDFKDAEKLVRLMAERIQGTAPLPVKPVELALVQTLEAEQNTQANTTATPQATAAVGTIGEPLVVNGLALEVNNVERHPATGLMAKPNSDNVVVDLTLTNNTAEPLDYSPLDFKFKDEQGFEYRHEFGITEQDMQSGTLVSGDKIRAQVGFLVPVTAQEFTLAYNAPRKVSRLPMRIALGSPHVQTLTPTPTVTARPTDTPEPTNTNTPIPTSTVRPINTPLPTSVLRTNAYIPGLTTATLMNKFEQVQMVCTNPEKGQLYYFGMCEAADPSTKLVVEYYGRTPETVDFINAIILQYDTPSQANAIRFLGYVATVNYDGAQPQTASTWVQSTIPMLVGVGDIRDRKFGGVNFELFGIPSSLNLQIGTLQ